MSIGLSYQNLSTASGAHDRALEDRCLVPGGQLEYFEVTEIKHETRNRSSQLGTAENQARARAINVSSVDYGNTGVPVEF